MPLDRADDDPLAAAGLADGTSWQLVTFVVDGEEVVPAAEAPVTLARDDGGVHGSTGCNRYRGDLAAAAGAEVLFPPLAMTRRMCVDQDIQRVESMYVAALAAVVGAESTEDLLILSSASATLIYARAAAE